MKICNINKYLCKIGENSKDNWNMLLEVKNEYLFFHLSSFPSCYVILECIEYPDINSIKECALVCKNNTKYKNIPNLYVDYTLCCNVEKGKNIGEVIYKSNRKVRKIKV